MIQILLIVHLLIALAMIGVVLLQRSEGGGLGIGGGGGGGGGMGGFMTGRGTANVLTRATAILAALFMVSSISLAILTGGDRAGVPASILDQAPPPAAGEGAVPETSGTQGTGTPGTGSPGSGSSTPSVPVQ
ncbi:MAG: preprotein translocase subunit SecG [Tistlia sp.]|uniref:preprotein translocase subunit SecG n=1 Tax=Tistlia sp. TaxID=3057121 RepID=UPI0034A19868